jgi:hypothetical protein
MDDESDLAASQWVPADSEEPAAVVAFTVPASTKGTASIAPEDAPAPRVEQAESLEDRGEHTRRAIEEVPLSHDPLGWSSTWTRTRYPQLGGGHVRHLAPRRF